MSDNANGSDGTETRKRAAPVPAKDFIRIYQASESVAEVAKATGLTVHTVSQRASTYRKKGVPLKAMPNNGVTTRNDWDELAELARSLMPEDATLVASAATEEEE
tara:strand:- start:1200 stop:1514 length:315 start_codon:yes stop_codon:yes gene_type:complete